MRRSPPRCGPRPSREGRAPPEEALSAVRIGPHRPLARLGIGGQGVVHLALDATGRRLVALKAPFRQLARDPSRRQRFRRECELHLALVAPHVVRALAADPEAEAPWLALEYLRGRPLSACLADGPLELVEALDVLEDAAEALATLHRQGIVHRDLKPSNLHVTERGRTLVLDLGIASRVEEGPDELGTFLYAAPEVNRGEPASPRSDLWSLGAVAFEVLTGSRALSATTLPGALHEQSAGPVPDPRDFAPLVPTELADLIREATHPDPGARPSTAGDMGRCLRTLRTALEAARPGRFALHRARREVLDLAFRGPFEALEARLEELARAWPDDPWWSWTGAAEAREAGRLAPARAWLQRAAGHGLDARTLALEEARLHLLAGDLAALRRVVATLAGDPDPLVRALEALATPGPSDAR